jgi:hypothetical protein
MYVWILGKNCFILCRPVIARLISQWQGVCGRKSRGKLYLSTYGLQKKVWLIVKTLCKI